MTSSPDCRLPLAGTVRRRRRGSPRPGPRRRRARPGVAGAVHRAATRGAACSRCPRGRHPRSAHRSPPPRWRRRPGGLRTRRTTAGAGAREGHSLSSSRVSAWQNWLRRPVNPAPGWVGSSSPPVTSTAAPRPGPAAQSAPRSARAALLLPHEPPTVTCAPSRAKYTVPAGPHRARTSGHHQPPSPPGSCYRALA
jgi:hypothetical protein